VGVPNSELFPHPDDLFGLILEDVVAEPEVHHVLVVEEACGLELLKLGHRDRRLGDFGRAGVVAGQVLGLVMVLHGRLSAIFTLWGQQVRTCLRTISTALVMSTSPHDPDLSPIGVRIEHQQIIFKPVMAFLLTPFEVGRPGALDVIPFVMGRFFCRCYPGCYPVAFPPSCDFGFTH